MCDVALYQGWINATKRMRDENDVDGTCIPQVGCGFDVYCTALYKPVAYKADEIPKACQEVQKILEVTCVEISL